MENRGGGGSGGQVTLAPFRPQDNTTQNDRLLMIVCPSWPILSPVSLNSTLSCTWETLTGTNVCVCRVERRGCILEIKPPSPMVDCPTIDTHSVALKGSLRHQWINSYASIHHPPPFSSGRSTSSTLSLWIFWGFEHNSAKPSSFSKVSTHINIFALVSFNSKIYGSQNGVSNFHTVLQYWHIKGYSFQ